jgi:uncharacterized protein with HEPN domain
MFDRELAREILRQIGEAADKVLARFHPIEQVADFTDTPAGSEKMDAICMLLIVIGESLKNLDKITAGTLLVRYPEVEISPSNFPPSPSLTLNWSIFPDR